MSYEFDSRLRYKNKHIIGDLNSKMTVKKKFKVVWEKSYIRTGEVEVEANSPEEAYHIVDGAMGDFDGKLQYLAEENDITVIGEIVNLHSKAV